MLMDLCLVVVTILISVPSSPEEEEECSLFDPKYKHININTLNNHVILN